MDKIEQDKLDEELAQVIAETTQSRVSMTEAIVLIRKMEAAGWRIDKGDVKAVEPVLEGDDVAPDMEPGFDTPYVPTPIVSEPVMSEPVKTEWPEPAKPAEPA